MWGLPASLAPCPSHGPSDTFVRHNPPTIYPKPGKTDFLQVASLSTLRSLLWTGRRSISSLTALWCSSCVCLTSVHIFCHTDCCCYFNYTVDLLWWNHKTISLLYPFAVSAGVLTIIRNITCSISFVALTVSQYVFVCFGDLIWWSFGSKKTHLSRHV